MGRAVDLAAHEEFVHLLFEGANAVHGLQQAAHLLGGKGGNRFRHSWRLLLCCTNIQ
jgi:hypothetical protein